MRDPKRAALFGILLGLVPVACDDLADEPNPTPTKRAPQATPPPPKPPTPKAADVVERQRSLMGTIFKVSLYSHRPAQAARAADEALDEVGRIEGILSEWQAGSEIARINRQAGKEPVKVGPETLAVVKAGVEVSKWSNGAFDLSWAALWGLYDFRPARQQVPDLATVREKRKLINWRNIAIDETASTVFLKQPGMAIGTGSIAKGYALDRIGARLREAGFGDHMLFAGGQVQVSGRRGDRHWRVGIQHPRAATFFGVVESEGGSISTSGDYEHFFVDGEGKRWHHIIDTKTGLPATRSLAATVHCERGIYADALSTAAFVLGPQAARSMFKKLPFSADFLIVDPNRKIHVTRNMPARLNDGIQDKL